MVCLEFDFEGIFELQIPYIQYFLFQVVEAKVELTKIYPIKNVQAALLLVQWLPDIQSHDLQIWLSDWLRRLCSSSVHNRMFCCNEGLISAILNILHREKQINQEAVGMDHNTDCQLNEVILL